MTRNNNVTRVKTNLHRIGGRIISRARRNKDIIFGARSINKQIGIFGRKTKDYDIFTKKAKQSAMEVEKHIDMMTRGDNFFVKRGRHPTTWKVKWKGKDGIKNTKDDSTIVDFSKTPKPTPKFKIINGVRYRTLGEEIKSKLKAIRDKRFAFRREKDLDDLRRIIKAGRSVRRG